MKILVVDDERAIRLLLMQELTAEGHVVATASSAGAAREEVERFHPDVVLLDVQLGPGMNGVELASTLPRGLPIIFMSGVFSSSEIHDMTEEQHAGINAGPLNLGKPINLDILKRALLEALSRRKPW